MRVPTSGPDGLLAPAAEPSMCALGTRANTACRARLSGALGNKSDVSRTGLQPYSTFSTAYRANVLIPCNGIASF